MAMEEGCVGMAISSHRIDPDPEESVSRAAGRSPISIAVPGGKQPPLVLDMGAVLLPRTEALMAEFPHAFFKGLGLGAVNAALGGILAGVQAPGESAPGSGWVSGQGSFLTAWDVSRFIDLQAFRSELDRYVEKARNTKPLPGLERAELAGGMEHEWDRENHALGIPLSDEHCRVLSKVATTVGLPDPCEAFEGERF
jgi:LDH2 family malate/lactate/ureidoglycolate dehydrogenase